MKFRTYDDSTRVEFDSMAQKQLDQLVHLFGDVGVKEVKESEEWCVRIVTRNSGESLPLAALGNTALQAAERLLRITQSRRT